MIYLICARDSKQRVVEISDKDELNKNFFYKYLINGYEHKNILYPIEFYTSIIKNVLPNRVNIIYAKKPTRRLPNIVNAIVINNNRDIVRSYKNDADDIYIFATSQWIIEEFGKLADYLIVFSCDEIGFTMQSLPDILDFSVFNILKNENPTDLPYHIEYYVSNKVGK